MTKRVPYAVSRTRRPKTKTKRCAHCKRRRRSKFIEWHPGIFEWQCSDFSDCDAVIAATSPWARAAGRA